MRKVLSFVLVLAMILGSVSMAFAATPSDVVGTDSEEAVNVLMEFGVVTGYSDGSFRPTGIVTRAEMAAFIIRALGLNPNAAAATQFSDVPSTHWASKYVVYAASLGIILGRTSTIFDPDATVSYDEAVTMLVRALGYTEASLIGSYPAAYVSKAKALEIIGDIQAGTAGANRGDIAQLVFNTLDCTIGKVNSENTWIASDASNGVLDTMMKRLGAEGFSPTGAVANEGDAFIVTTEFADDAVANIRNYIGAYVTAYANSDNEIIAINEVKSVFLTGDLAGDEFEVGSKTYGFSRAVEESYYDEATEVVLNSLYSTDGDIDATTNGAVADGTYTLAVSTSGNYIKDVYSIVDWAAEAIEKVTDDEVAEIDEDLSLFGYDFPLDDDDEINMAKVALFGADTLADIEEDNIVTIYLNSDGDIGKLEVGTTVVEGTVSRVTGGDTFTVAGSKYSWADDALVSVEAMDVTDEVTLWLDYSGDIADAEVNANADADSYGIILEYVNGEDGTFGDDAKINLFLADGTTKVFVADADEIEDATIISTGAAWNWVTTGGITTGGLVKYGLDSDGVIVSLEYQDPHGDSVLDSDVDEDVSSRGYYVDRKIDAGVVVFTYDNTAATKKMVEGTAPADTAILDNDDDLFGTGTYTALLGAEEVRGRIYFDTDSQTIVAMLIDADSTSADDAVYAMYNSEFEEDNNTGYGANLLKLGDSDTTEYVVTEGVYDNATAATSSGILKLVFNTLGEVKDVEVVSADVEDTTYASIQVGATTTITSIKIDNDVATFTVTGTGLFTIIDAGSMVETTGTTVASILLDMDNLTIYEYDADEDEWVKVAKSTFTTTNETITADKLYAFYDLIDNDGVADTILMK